MTNQSEPMLEGLTAFVAVVDAGGFTAAAQRLQLQKATVSRRVQALEAHLGAQLLERTTRRSRLTELGETYYEHAARAVESARAAEEAVRVAQSSPGGTLRVSVPQLLGELIADSVILPFLRELPRVSLELEVATRPVEPLRDGYDIVVCPGELADSSTRAKRLPVGAAVLVATPHYLQRAGTPEHPRDLARHDAVIGTVGADNEWPLYGPEGPIRVSPRVRLRTPLVRVALRAARAGLGIAVFPRFFVAPLLSSGRLVTVLEAWTQRAPPMSVLYPAKSYALPSVKLFVSLLVSAMKRRGT